MRPTLSEAGEQFSILRRPQLMGEPPTRLSRVWPINCADPIRSSLVASVELRASGSAWLPCVWSALSASGSASANETNEL